MRQTVRHRINLATTKLPFVVVIALAGAWLGNWLPAPPVLAYISTALLTLVALVVWAALVLPVQFKSIQELGFARHRDWLRYELKGAGSPRGYYPLAALCIVAIFGLRWPFAAVGYASFAVTILWAMARRRWPNQANGA